MAVRLWSTLKVRVKERCRLVVRKAHRITWLDNTIMGSQLSETLHDHHVARHSDRDHHPDIGTSRLSQLAQL